MGNGTEIAKLEQLLIEIRDDQRTQLQRQAESLALQKHQLDLLQSQLERAAELQTRAEKLHEKSAGLVQSARNGLLIVVLPLLMLALLVILLARWIN